VLVAAGTAAEHIAFQADEAPGMPGYWVGLEFRSTAGSLLEHCLVRDAGAGTDGAIVAAGVGPRVVSSTIEGNAGNGVFRDDRTGESGPLVIIGSRIAGNSAHGVAIYRNDAEIRDSVIVGNGAQGIHVDGGSFMTIERNRVQFNGGGGLDFTFFNGVLRDNSIAHNVVGGAASAGIAIQFVGPAPTIANNDIFGNRMPDGEVVDLRNLSDSRLAAPGNWWGTTDADAIAAHVVDFRDDRRLGPVVVAPVLQAPAMPAFAVWRVLLPRL
jgi:hypothetical protein